MSKSEIIVSEKVSLWSIFATFSSSGVRLLR